MKNKPTLLLALALAAGIGIGLYLAGERPMFLPVETAEAQARYSPTQPLAEHDVYYPGTEALGPNEMRVVALGTGMPTIRSKTGGRVLPGGARQW